MTDNPETPRLRKDGSIDTGYYMARGRVLRSEQAHRMMGRQPGNTRPRAAPLRRFPFV